MNRKIWGIILAILVIGLFITQYTRNYVVQEKTVDLGIEESSVMQDYSRMQNQISETNDSVKSPLETTALLKKSIGDMIYESESTESETEKGVSSYRRRLMELDTEIARIRKEEPATNVQSIKSLAESELKLWDSERGYIYAEILKVIDQEQKEYLIQEEKDWSKARAHEAMELAIQKIGKSISVDSLDYSTALTTLTRKRVYDLVSEYEVLLESSYQ